MNEPDHISSSNCSTHTTKNNNNYKNISGAGESNQDDSPNKSSGNIINFENIWDTISTLDIAMILEHAPPDTTCCVNCADIVGQVVFSLNGCQCVVAKMKLPNKDPIFHDKRVTEHATIHMIAHLMSFFSKSVNVEGHMYIFKEIIHIGPEVLSLILNAPDLRGVCDMRKRTLTIEKINSSPSQSSSLCTKQTMADILHDDIELSASLTKLVHRALINKQKRRKKKIKRL